jgi:PadR family transcriptional regulator PadR
MTTQALKGHLDLLVLAVLARGPRHGYAIIEGLRDDSDEVFDLAEGTVYPVLHRLERDGALASEWIEAGGRRRRQYRITASGTARLAREQASWQLFATAVTRVLGGRSWPSPA